uniref:Uncharacterized protein n=2 Tax=Cuerna arida TaxID=1464854 RepID=A0A1B6F6I3_9HEMI
MALKEELDQSLIGPLDQAHNENKEKSLLKEIEELKTELQNLRLENDSLINQEDKYNTEIAEKANEIKTLEKMLDEKVQQSLEDHNKLITIQSENISLRNEIKELQQIVEQYKEEQNKKCDFSLNISAPICEENLGQSVIDKQLMEKQEVIEQLKNQLSSLQAVVNDKSSEVSELLKTKMDLEDSLQSKQITIEEMNKVCSDLQEEIKKLSSRNKTLESDLTNVNITSISHAHNSTLREDAANCRDLKDIEAKNDSLQRMQEEIDLLKKQIAGHDPHLKEAYKRLFDDFHRLNDEMKMMTSKYNNVTEANKNIRAEYDAKLKKIKDHMKETCTRAMQQTEETCAKKIKQHQEVIKSSQDHITQLSSQLWDTSDKLIITKKENNELKKTVVKLKKSLTQQSSSLQSQRSRSYEHLEHSTPEMRLEIDESITVSRRQSIRTVPSDMGKVFPSEDEVDEMFSNECLADLKAGRCHVPTDPDRISTLKYRNSLCPPHLKSSYPAETQFLPIDTIREDDIKGRAGDGDDKSLLSEKHRRKDSKTQTSYKRPGPPTPSKHGARVSSQTLTTTPRNVLREVNDLQKKPGTPSRLFSQFFTARQRDENTPTTTNQRRLSFFNKHFGKREGSQKNSD